MAKKNNLVGGAKAKISLILIAGMAAGWGISGYTVVLQNSVRKQNAMVEKAEEFIPDKLYIRAANQYKEALKAKKLSYSEGLVFESKYRYEEGYNLAERIIASKATAAFVTGDELAAGLLNGLADQGVNVPEDFELITSDDSQITRYTRPNLSTVGQPLYDLGAISMRMLTKIMHKEELEEREVLLAHTINHRGTTKK